MIVIICLQKIFEEVSKTEQRPFSENEYLHGFLVFKNSVFSFNFAPFSDLLIMAFLDLLITVYMVLFKVFHSHNFLRIHHKYILKSLKSLDPFRRLLYFAVEVAIHITLEYVGMQLIW